MALARVIVRPRAERDLYLARVWYDGERAGLSDAFGAAIDLSIQVIASQPRAFQALGVLPHVRRYVVPVFPYVIYYTVPSARQIVIVRVLHARRDAPAQLGRRRRRP